jgi:hypothetical protein
LRKCKYTSALFLLHLNQVICILYTLLSSDTIEPITSQPPDRIMASTTDLPLPTHVLHEFPKPSWIENLAVRSNGQLLFTVLTSPDLYLLDPSKPSKPILIRSFDGYLGLLGITEIESDIFYVAAGNFNISTFDTGTGSYAVWEVDMRNFSLDNSLASGLQIKKIVDIPEAVLLNGMETFSGPASEPFALVADSGLGVVWKVDPKTGKYSTFVAVQEMKPPAEGMPIGINGIKIRDGYLYWSNSGLQLFCRIAIGEDGAKGETEVVKKDVFTDDFVFDDKGNAWLAQNVFNTIGVLMMDGNVVTAAGKADQLTVAGPTACRFGRGPEDQHMLYVATTGGIGAPINGTEFEGAKVISVDTRAFGM